MSTDGIYNGIDPADVSVTNIDDDIVTATFTKIENKSIPDRGTYTSSLAIAPTGRILDLNVRVNITHDWDEDLDVFLIAPDGTRTELFTDVGGMGANFTNTVLDDEATTSITAGSAPFTGTYLPEGNLTLTGGKEPRRHLEAGSQGRRAVDRGHVGGLVDHGPLHVGGLESPGHRYSDFGAGHDRSGRHGQLHGQTRQPADRRRVPFLSAPATHAKGRVSTSSLIFTPSNWNTAQTVTVTGVDDIVVDGNVGYTIVLGLATSADPDFNGLNPTDVSVTNTDNDIPPTKFYVVNDASQNLTYEYGASGSAGRVVQPQQRQHRPARRGQHDRG